MYSPTLAHIFKSLHYYVLIFIVFFIAFNTVSCVKKNIDTKVLNDFDFDTGMSPTINNLLEVLDANKALLDSSPPLSTEESRELSKKLMVEWTYQSNAIEGNSLTLEETNLVLLGGSVAGKSFEDIKEVHDHQKAIEYVTDLVKEEKRESCLGPLTEFDIHKIHSLILGMKVKPKDHQDAGGYRRIKVKVRGTELDPPEPKSVPQHMTALMEWYRNASDIHPIKRTAIFHARFEMIHPFVHGNGRTGRLIANLELMKFGYPPGIICLENSAWYYDAIQSACKYNDYSLMTLEIALSVAKTLDEYLDMSNLFEGRKPYLSRDDYEMEVKRKLM